MKFVLALLASIVFSVTTLSTARAASYAFSIEDGELTVYLTGPIEVGEMVSFNHWYHNVMTDPSIPPSRIVLNSGGGSMFDGMEFADIIHKNGIKTEVPHGGLCASVCFNMWAAGSERSVSTRSRLGVHRPYAVKRREDGTIDMSVRKDGAEATKFLSDQLISFGVPTSIVEVLKKTPGDDMHFLTADELADFNVVLVEPEPEALTTKVWRSIFGD